MSAIDWTIFDQYPENTVTCRCGVSYRSHTKMDVGDDRKLHLHCRKPCPACGSTIDPRRASSDPETRVIKEEWSETQEGTQVSIGSTDDLPTNVPVFDGNTQSLNEIAAHEWQKRKEKP
jgi:hypothetical protein